MSIFQNIKGRNGLKSLRIFPLVLRNNATFFRKDFNGYFMRIHKLNFSKDSTQETAAATKGFLQRFFKNFAIFKIKHLCRRIFLIKLEARWAILKTYFEQYVGTTASEKRNAT